jgi:trans-2,3-dihydro-3-hydroxyanthranilate isomerase
LPTFRFHTLDVFTSVRFGGNPLAVVLDAGELSDEAMQAIAREFNLSETVFLAPPASPENTAKVRIFTPARELPFAGHPTLGAAVLLARVATAPREADERRIRLEEVVGTVEVVVRSPASDAPYAELRAPALPVAIAGPPSDRELAAVLGLAPSDIGFGAHRASSYRAGISFVFVPLASRDALARARFDAAAWNRVPHQPAEAGVYLYTPGAAGEPDFHARMFSPGAGITEDPATGSAAAALAGPLAAATTLADGTHRWQIAQGEDMRRPSRLHLEADFSGGRPRALRVGGHAVAVTRGEIST